MSYEILPLARFMWRHSDVECPITFQTSGRVPQGHLVQSNAAETHRKILHNFSNAVIEEDALNIKRYAYSDRLLANVSLNPRLNSVVVDYKATTTANEPSPETFHVTQLASSPRFTKLPSVTVRLGLYSLTGIPINRVQEFTCLSSIDVTLDLDTRNLHGLDISFFQESEVMIYGTEDLKVPVNIILIITATSDKSESNFNHFSSLGELYDIGGGGLAKFLQALHSHPATTIALNLDLATTTTLDQARIDISGLMQLLESTQFSPKAKILITLTCPNGRGARRVSANVNLLPLQKGIFLLLADIMTNWPIKTRDAGGAKLPQIWITGRGALVKACYPQSEGESELSVEYMHGTLREKEMDNRGYRMCSIPSNEGAIEPFTGSALLLGWLGLQSQFWHDYRTARWGAYFLSSSGPYTVVGRLEEARE
jgi:hypothetical protein